MSLLRPVAQSQSGSQGDISQPFAGTFWWEPAGWFRNGRPDRGKRSRFTNSSYRSHIHLAIDYIVAQGTPVRAVKAGTIVAQGTDSSGAVFIYLRVRNGTKHQVCALYYHLQNGSFTRKVGDTVRKGDIIARSGNTGLSTGPHLHFELIRGRRGQTTSDLYRKGLRVDPQPFIDGTAKLKEIAP